MRLATVAVALLAVGAACGSDVRETAEEPPVDVGRISCSKTAVAASPRVRARRDGVHLHVDVSSQDDVSVTLMGEDGGPGGVSGPLVHPFAPGPVTVQCYRIATDTRAEVDFEVVDGGGFWVSTRLDCKLIVNTTPDYVGDPQSDIDPVEQTRKKFADVLRDGDRVERAGYPDRAEATTRVVRDGKVVAVVEFRRSGVTESNRWCESFAP